MELKFYLTFGAKGKIKKFFRKYIPLNNRFWDLILNTRSDDIVTVYHSLNYMIPIMLANKIRKFNLVLEVEEIYLDVSSFTNRIKRNEYKMLNITDKYISFNRITFKKIECKKLTVCNCKRSI